MNTYAPSLTKSCAVANPMPSVPPVITATFPCNLPMVFPLLSPSRSSNCEDDPAERPALNQVTQRFSRIGQREGLSHDRFDRAGFKQRDNDGPSFSNDRVRLSEHIETPDAGLRHDKVCHINGCLAACGIPQCCEASFKCKRSEPLAQDFAADSVDDNVCAVTAGDAAHAVSQPLHGCIDDFT